MLSIDCDRAANLDWLSEFYRQCGYGGKVQPEDRVFFAVDNNQIQGVVRLAQEKGACILRGMQVVRNQQQRGIGKRLLAILTQTLDGKECFCLPYTHLEQFYGQAGFITVADAELPGFLRERKQGYLHREMDVIAMARKDRQ